MPISESTPGSRRRFQLVELPRTPVSSPGVSLCGPLAAPTLPRGTEEHLGHYVPKIEFSAAFWAARSFLQLLETPLNGEEQLVLNDSKFLAVLEDDFRIGLHVLDAISPV